MEEAERPIENEAPQEQAKEETEDDMGDVDAALLAALTDEMGFDREVACRALRNSGATDVEAAVNFLVDHPDGGKPKSAPSMSKEEAIRKRDEFLQKRRAEIAAVEAAAEKEREKERIRSGKELAATMREVEDAERQRRIQERAREKKEMEDARAKIKAELEKDKRERLAARGISTSDASESAEKDAAQAESAAGTVATPAIIAEKVRQSLRDAKQALQAAEQQSNTDDLWRACLMTLGKIVTNAIKDDPKYWKIRTDSNVFRSKIAPVKGAETILQLAGFDLSEDSSAWVLSDRKRHVSVLERAAEEISKAMSNPYFGAF